MKNFKPNQFVVFRRNASCTQDHPAFKWPKDGEVVKLNGACLAIDNHWFVYGYDKSLEDHTQSFHEDCLFPLKSESFPLMKFTEILKKEQKDVLIEN